MIADGARNSTCRDVGPNIGSMNELYDRSLQLNNRVIESHPGVGCTRDGTSSNFESRDTAATLNNRGLDSNRTSWFSSSNLINRDQKEDKITIQRGENFTSCLENTDHSYNIPDMEYEQESPCEKTEFTDPLPMERNEDAPKSISDTPLRLKEEDAGRNTREHPSGNIPLSLPF